MLVRRSGTRLLVQQSWTRCLMSSEIRHVVLTVLNSFLRRSCLLSTNVSSALEVILNDIHYINPRFTHTHTHPFNSLFSGLPRWAGTRKETPIWILQKQETVSGSGIRWAICKSAPRSSQITTPVPHHSIFYRPDALPVAQPTASKHWRHSTFYLLTYLLTFLCYWQETTGHVICSACSLEGRVSITNYVIQRQAAGINFWLDGRKITGKRVIWINYLAISLQ